MQIYESVIFSKEECLKIIDYTHSNITPKKVINGKGVSYDYFKILHNTDIAWLFKKMYDEFSKITKIEIIDYTSELSLNQYQVGNLFSKHIDRNQIHSNRVWNIGIVLNDDYTGGDYNYYIDGVKHTFKKEIGNFIVYESSLPHEITEITSGVRMAIVKILDIDILKYTKHGLI